MRACYPKRRERRGRYRTISRTRAVWIDGQPFATAAAIATWLFLPSPAAAQLNGQNIKGDAGLKSGSQAPPGAYGAIPLWFYSADALKGREGNELLTGNLDAAVFGLALNVVTARKVIGANYGFLVALPWANNRVQGAEDFDSNPGAGLTDMFIQPITLGWHRPRADIHRRVRALHPDRPL